MSYFHPHHPSASSGRSTSTSPQPAFYPHLTSTSTSSTSSSSSSSSSIMPREHQHPQQSQSPEPSSSSLRKRSLTTASESTSRSASKNHLTSADEDEEMEGEGTSQSSNNTNSGYKRTRKLLTPEQSKALHEMLEKTHFPSTSAREEIAKRLNITPRKVQVFFQNKRQKARRHTLNQSSRRGEPLTFANAARSDLAEASRFQQPSPSFQARPLPAFRSHSSSSGDFAASQLYSYPRDSDANHQREVFPHLPSLNQAHSHHLSQSQHPLLPQQLPQSHSQGDFSSQPLTLLQGRSSQQYPTSLFRAPGTQFSGSASSSHSGTFTHLSSAESRRRAFSDAPHRLDTLTPSPGVDVLWDDRSQNETGSRRLAPLPQGRRIELPPIPAGLAAAPNPNFPSSQSASARLNSPPLPPIFSTPLPPLRLNSGSGRRQEDEDALTDEERSISSKASSQAEPVDISLSSRLQNQAHEGSLPASPFPHLFSSSNITSRGRADSDPFFRERAMGGSTRGSLSPVTVNSTRSIPMNRPSQSQDSSVYPGREFSSSPSSSHSKSRHSPYVLPPLSSGLASSTSSGSQSHSGFQSQDVLPSSSLQQSDPLNTSASQPPKRPTEVVRLPSLSQLNIDVVENRERESSQESKVHGGGNNDNSSGNMEEDQ